VLAEWRADGLESSDGEGAGAGATGGDDPPGSLDAAEPAAS
jgi:hypothetical protein